MEQNFQTSFIPKKPIVLERASSPRQVGLFTIVSIFLFFTMLLATGGLYFYDKILEKKIIQMQADLDLATKRFEPSKIAQLKSLDKRLYAANEILSKHISVSPIFEALEAITIKSIGYTKFSYALEDESKKNPRISIIMSGVSRGYAPIALQSDLFANNKNIIDPVFSNLKLDEKGNVLFDLNFSVDKDFVNYKKVLKASLELKEESDPLSVEE